MQVVRCPICASDMPSTAKFCPECGALSEVETLPTLPGVPRGDSRSPSSPGSDSSVFEQARFVPGQILAGRYRIVAMLGKGGMGEVYRADDLRLGQAVALKFLPEALARDGATQARFHREVRFARQVSHPNVCRVFDIGEAAGLPFLTMEYVDGEDLASLLRRIGHLPQDKAVDISRQLCAGLSAAHEAGVLHRDLKPANVMLDSRGKIRITDFGLAGLAGPGEQDNIGGTLAYMAPEQLAGEPATAQSDIYSLGLVLYELFTGKAAFEAATVAELVRQHATTTPKNPSQLVHDLDPVVERVILRCLEPKPEQRPRSALQVAAALPGGDPLAAALAAGETPSPEMVAAAGGEGALQPKMAWSLLGAALVVLGCIVALAPYSTDLGLAPTRRNLSALQERAEEIIERAGYTAAPADRVSWFERNYDFMLYQARHFPTSIGRREFQHAELGVLTYNFRQSPYPLVSNNLLGRIDFMDPPHEISGMLTVVLDGNGRLVGFMAVPPQVEASPPSAVAPDWNPMLADSGLDPASLRPADSTWLPPIGFDRRFGWRGFYPEDPKTEIQISAASYGGKPVYFHVIGPWARPWRMKPVGPNLVIAQTTMVIGGFVTLILAALFARRNIRLGRGDRRGALRISALLFAISLMTALLLAHHVRDLNGEWSLLVQATSGSLFIAAFVWLYYLGFEPFVRKQWPELLISWSRLLAGKFRDPIIGRDLLVGALLGSLMAFGSHLANALPTWFNLTGQTTISANPVVLASAAGAVGFLLRPIAGGLFSAFSITFTLFVIRFLVRSYWASVLLSGLLVLLTFMGGENFLLETPFAVLNSVIIMFALLRFGILALAVTFFTISLLTSFPITLDLSLWYAPQALLMFAMLAVMLAYGMRTALGNQPLLASD